MDEGGGRRMRLAGVYSFNGGKEAVTERYPKLLVEVNDVIKAVDASRYKIKASKEETKPGRILFDPTSLNKAFKAELKTGGGRERALSATTPHRFTLKITR